MGIIHLSAKTLTLNFLKRRKKPVYILNRNGFRDPFFDMMDAFEASGFIYPGSRGLLEVRRTVEEAVAALKR